MLRYFLWEIILLFIYHQKGNNTIPFLKQFPFWSRDRHHVTYLSAA